MSDLSILKAMFSKEFRDRYSQFINTKFLTKEAYDIYSALSKKKEDVAIDSFETDFYHVDHPDWSPKIVQLYRKIFQNIRETEVESSEQLVAKYKEEETKQKIEEAMSSKINITELEEILDQHRKHTKFAVQEWITNDLQSIIAKNKREGGLKWRLQCLNNSLGGLIKGDFGLIAAYVDTGKSTLLSSEVTHMATQVTDGTILWLNNEEYDERVQMRLWQSLLNSTWQQIEDHHVRAEEQYSKRMHGDMDRIKLVDIRQMSMMDIRQLFKTHNPKLVVIDQIDKIKIGASKDAKKHSVLKDLYGEMRFLANEYCPIIAISQCDATTVWKDKETNEMNFQHWIGMSQLDESKVGKQGELDFIITIGRDANLPNSRFIHVPKNKIGRGVYDRHIRQEVSFNGDTARYENPGEIV